MLCEFIKNTAVEREWIKPNQDQITEKFRC